MTNRQYKFIVIMYNSCDCELDRSYVYEGDSINGVIARMVSLNVFEGGDYIRVLEAEE